MQFRKAKIEDLPVMMGIIEEAQASLKALGINQWQNGYPSKEVIENDINNHNAYVLTDNNTITGMATVIFNNEPTYDVIYNGKWLSINDFVVVHRLAVSEKEKKKGIASKIIGEVSRLAKTKNISSFKIDTHEGNYPMQRMLMKNGFVKCGTIILKDGNPRIALEKLI